MERLDLTQNEVGTLYADIKSILQNGRKQAYTAINFIMVESYWQVGQRIVEYEQAGAARAEYGKSLMKELSIRLTEEFGKGFDERELRKIRQFYLLFQKRDTLRPELTWSHYRRLLSVENENARIWYIQFRLQWRRNSCSKIWHFHQNRLSLCQNADAISFGMHTYYEIEPMQNSKM